MLGLASNGLLDDKSILESPDLLAASPVFHDPMCPVLGYSFTFPKFIDLGSYCSAVVRDATDCHFKIR